MDSFDHAQDKSARDVQKHIKKFCNHCTIIFILYNSFMSKRVNVSKKVLQHLYWDERKSSIEIAKLYKCHSMTIRNRIRELGITKRTPSDARMHYEKHDFSENSIERAYLLGFRLGDLSAYQTSVDSELIVVRCHTTQLAQVTLMQSLFSSYGRVTVSKRNTWV